MTLHDISRGRRSARTCDCHACRPSRDPRDHDGGTLATVRLRGWQVAVVSSEQCGVEGCTDHEDRIRAGLPPSPRWAYTVGLGHTADHPELLIAGLEPELMGSVLDRIAEWVARCGMRFAPGDGAQPWTVDCGDVHDEAELVAARLLDVVRLAPSVRGLADLLPGSGAERPEVDWPWRRFGPPTTAGGSEGGGDARGE